MIHANVMKPFSKLTF